MSIRDLEIRNTLVDPDLDRYPKTYNGFDASESSSACQKEVRRGNWDAVSWGLELYWTSPNQRTNIWNRILVMGVEDVGLANPYLIRDLIQLKIDHDKMVEGHKWGTGCYQLVGQALYLLVQSPKSRINDWVAHISDFGFNVEVNLDTAGQMFHQSLNQKDPISCLFWANKIWNSEEKLKGKYRKASYLVWEILKQCLDDQFHSLYTIVRELGLSSNWRWTGKSRLLWIHLIMCHCHLTGSDSNLSGFDSNLSSNLSDQTWANTNLSQDQQVRLSSIICQTYERKYDKQVPDYALDKHTLRGSAMGRGIEHFLQFGAKLNNVPEHLIKWEQHYLRLSFGDA